MALLEKLNSLLLSPVFVASVILTGTVLFVKFGYLIVLHPKKTVSAFFGRGSDKRGTSAYKSAALALASTMGVGNIVGVSTAIAAGGPGAVFWMTASALIAMSVKYAEVALGVDCRIYKEGKLHGGAPYYFGKYSGRAAGAVFAVLLVVNSLTVGNIVQSNAFAECASVAFGVKACYAGLFFFILIAFAVIKKKRTVENVTAAALPAATVLFTVFAVIALIKGASGIGGVIKLIFDGAFGFRPAAAGACGYALSRAVRFGVARGIMSNEAGSGTSPTAHSLTEKSPAEQGLFGIFEVFADTVLTCNLTAFVILLAFGSEYSGMTGMELVLSAFGKFFGIRAGAIITASVLIFAFATVVSQFYYGREAVFFLTDGRKAEVIFETAFLFCVYAGSVIPLDALWLLTDTNVCVMTTANCLFLLVHSDRVKAITREYYGKIKN